MAMHLVCLPWHKGGKSRCLFKYLLVVKTVIDPITLEVHQVLPGLYVGNYRDSKDAGQLERHKITHIIAIHDAARRLHTDKEYLCIMASDTPYQNLAQYFPACNDFIHTARIEGGNVLIHCLAGMSRSVTIVVAYIMSITSLRWNEALKVVRGARAVSNPNSGFQKQLQEFETNKLAEERKRMLEKFPGTTQMEHEEGNCRRLLIAYDHLLLSRAICEGRCNSARVCPTGTCRAHCASPRLSRQKSRESSVGQSPRGSTKSLDTSGEELPSSPKNWERHYGCWKNHFRHRQGTNSTPNSPILYRASSSKAQRSDSLLSISSVSSVTSLPGQMCMESREPGPYNISLVDRNPLLSTQSCPNSPRRVPRKMPQSGLSQADAARVVLANKEMARKTSSAISNTPSASTSSLSKSTGVLLRPGSSSSRTISNATTTTTASTKTSSSTSTSSTSTPITSTTATTTTSNTTGTSTTTVTSTTTGTPSTTTAVASSSSSSWGTPPTSNPCHRFMAHNASSGSTSASSTAKNFVKVSGGITRWVMKRSAYKYTLDKS